VFHINAMLINWLLGIWN